MFCKGQHVFYTKTGHTAIVMAIHYDDIVPYYTIIIPEQDKEIQTVHKYLKTVQKDTVPKKTRKKKSSLKQIKSRNKRKPSNSKI